MLCDSTEMVAHDLSGMACHGMLWLINQCSPTVRDSHGLGAPSIASSRSLPTDPLPLLWTNKHPFPYRDTEKAMGNARCQPVDHADAILTAASRRRVTVPCLSNRKLERGWKLWRSMLKHQWLNHSQWLLTPRVIAAVSESLSHSKHSPNWRP